MMSILADNMQILTKLAKRNWSPHIDIIGDYIENYLKEFIAFEGQGFEDIFDCIQKKR